MKSIALSSQSPSSCGQVDRSTGRLGWRAVSVCWGCITTIGLTALPVWAQSVTGDGQATPPPVLTSEVSLPTRAASKRPSMFATKWPFKWPFKKDSAESSSPLTVDPFLTQAPRVQAPGVTSTGLIPSAGSQATGNAAGYSGIHPGYSAVASYAEQPTATTWSATTSPPPTAPGANVAGMTSNAQTAGILPDAVQVAAYPHVGLPSAPAAVPASGTSTLTVPDPNAGSGVTTLGPPPLPAGPSIDLDRRGELDKGSRVLAIVGDQSVLYGDIAGQINEMLAPYEGQVPPEQLEMQRELLVQRFLPRIVDNKIVFLDFLRKIPMERMPEIEQQLFRQYNETQLPKVLEKTGLKSAAELDEYLRSMGSSLSKQQRMFLEQVMRHEAIRSAVTVDKEVSHEEMLAFYHEHADDYEFQARARWERLMVYKARFNSPAEAYQALVKMGNEVLRGAPLEAVARRSSQGPNAAEGGLFDWTTRGSLRSKQLDDLIFTMPTGKLSRILEDDLSYQIVRVVDRVDAGREQFADVQDEIRDKIREQRFNEEAEAYLDRLRAETYVWIADEHPGQVTPAGFTR